MIPTQNAEPHASVHGLRGILVRRRLHIVALLVAASLICASTPAQETKQNTQESSSKISVSVESVLVPVVVRDGQGRAIGNLKKEDFELLDRGKKQVISGFSIQQRESPGSGETKPQTANSSGAPNASASSNESAPPAGSPQRFIVFLFDDLHLNAGDLAQVQKAATRMLGESLAPADVAAVVTTSGSNSGLTRDRAKLQESIAKLHQVKLYQHDSHECPNIDYYEADLIQNKHEQVALETAMDNATACANLTGATREMVRRMVETAALRSLALGDQDVHVTLNLVREVVRRMGTLPGQRTLILISPGFLTITPEDMNEKSQVLDMAAQANVTVSALDARGLYSGQMDASVRGEDSMRALAQGIAGQYHRETSNLDEDVMSEFAAGSGGTYFHNNNDLEGGFRQLTVAPEYVYLLELSLEHVKRDGTYHVLTVKVDPNGLKLEARRGYFAPKPEKNQR